MAAMTEPAAPPSPFEEFRPAWRAAVLVDRAARRRGLCEMDARYAATGAYLALRPGDGWDEASDGATRAIAYAAARHTEWFWRGTR